MSARQCEEPGCASTTREGKPYCMEHLDRLPYAREVMRQVERPTGRTMHVEPVEELEREPAKPWQRACPVCGCAVDKPRRTYCSRRCVLRACGRRRHGHPISGPPHPSLGRPPLPQEKRVCKACGEPTGPTDDARMHSTCSRRMRGAQGRRAS